MKVVVVKSPKVISGLMRLIFKIKKEEEALQQFAENAIDEDIDICIE